MDPPNKHMKSISDSLDDIMGQIENINERVRKLTDLVEEMIMTQQAMYNKIEFLEKRINLVEKVNDYQDKELDILQDEWKA